MDGPRGGGAGIEPLEMEAARAPNAAQGRRASLLDAVQVMVASGMQGDDDSVGQETPEGVAGARRTSASDMSDQLHEARRSTLLAMETIKEIEEKSPEAINFLQSFQGLLLQVALLAFYVFVDTAKGLTNKWAMETGKVQASALVLLNCACSIVVGFTMAAKIDGIEQAKAACVDFQAIKQFAVVAALFNMSTILNIMAYGTTLDAGTIKILGQFRLPLSALLSRMFTGRVYSFNHWMILTIITITALAFYLGSEERDKESEHNLEHMLPEQCFMDYDPRVLHKKECIVDGHGKPTKSGDILGLIYLMGWVVIVVASSLMTEKFFKAASKIPFYIQKMQMEMSGVWVSIFMSFFVPAVVQGGAWDPYMAKKIWWSEHKLECLDARVEMVGGKGLFEGFGFRAFCQLIVAMLQGWVGGIIVKRFSTVVKNIAKSLSLILTVYANELIFKNCWEPDLSPIMYLLSFSIFCSTMVFSQLGENGARPQAHDTLGPPVLMPPPASSVLPPVYSSEHQHKRSTFSRSPSGLGPGMAVAPPQAAGAAPAAASQAEEGQARADGGEDRWDAAAAAEEEMKQAMDKMHQRGKGLSRWNSGIQQ